MNINLSLGLRCCHRHRKMVEASQGTSKLVEAYINIQV